MQWIDRIKTAVATAAGEEWLAAADARYQAFQDEPGVRVTLYGPYDAGKSSLLKRLLVEDGTAVPDWLVITGRPTTFETSTVSSQGITYVDTPGTDGVTADHDDIATAALVLTDAVLYTLTPQLTGRDAQRLAALAAGSAEEPAALVSGFPPEALVVAIAQADTAGGDPHEDRRGYDALCERKRAELRALLQRNGVTGAEPRVHVVAADPFGLVGNEDAPQPSDYDDGRDWDGIEGLRTHLYTLRERRADLRAHAQVRYWAWVSRRVQDEVAEEVRRLDDRIAELGVRTEELNIIERELRLLDEAAIAALTAEVREELTALADSGVVEVDDLQARAEQRIGGRLQRWKSTYDSRLTDLAGRARTELEIRAARAGGGELRAFLDEIVARGSRPGAGISTSGRDELGEHIKRVIGASFMLHHGMTPADARVELEKIARLRELDAAATVTTGFGIGAVRDPLSGAASPGNREPDRYAVARGGPGGAAGMDDMAQHLRVVEAIEVLLPTILQLVDFARTELDAGQNDEKVYRRRRQLQEAIPQAAEAITARLSGGADSEPQGWRAAVGALQKAIDERRPSATLVGSVRERRDVLEQARRHLAGLEGQRW